MTETSRSQPATAVSTCGVQLAYEFPRQPRSVITLKTELDRYGVRPPNRQRPVLTHEPPSTRPVSRGVYFAKVSQSAAIECGYFLGQNAPGSSVDPTELHHRGIESSLRDVNAMLYIESVNARAAGETTRPLLRPERGGNGEHGPVRTWIAQRKRDISEVIRTPAVVHRRLVLARLIDRVSELGRLEKGWNSYAAPAPTAVAVGNAKMLLIRAGTAGMIPERIEPSAMGGVGVTFTAGSREVAVEFYNAGNTHALFSDMETEELDTAPVAPDVEGYGELLAKVRQYLYAPNASARTPGPELP